jgi:hypothetical protein
MNSLELFWMLQAGLGQNIAARRFCMHPHIIGFHGSVFIWLATLGIIIAPDDHA